MAGHMYLCSLLNLYSLKSELLTNMNSLQCGVLFMGLRENLGFTWVDDRCNFSRLLTGYFLTYFALSDTEQVV